MKTDLIQITYRQELVGRRTFKTKYIAEITHRGLNDYKVLSADEKDILQNKVNAHVAKLEEKWERTVQKDKIIRTKEEMQNESASLTKEALKALEEIENLLLFALAVDYKIDFEKLKDRAKFKSLSPEINLSNLLASVTKPTEPVYQSYSTKPNPKDFQPEFSFFDNLIKSKKEAKINEANDRFEKAVNNWELKCKKIDTDNQKIKEQYNAETLKFEKQIKEIKDQNIKDIANWEKKKADFISKQDQANSKLDSQKEMYLNLDPNAITDYCELVLTNSPYPESFPKSFELDYNPETKILIVEYSLPSADQLPTLNEVRIVKNELKEYYVSEAQVARMFDATMYRITLRTIYELFNADAVNALEAISFNGWINAVNRATGKRENNCILSIQVKKTEFTEVDLKHVDPKTCFKNFKGVGSSKLSGLTAIQPILQISRTDKRFTNNYAVADSIDSSTNLASMDWEDFEHLIREVFAKEFSSNGGEVKVTQASRDGGVDAIAFDPDPIRGGKIVIQAKRYTNTVGVSAVRDLYGTVMNEGATKGILVTTADYGPDAYDFVKGKPLTLMNGSNLLFLLEKHGHKARIDIREARETLK